jgi:hypothetical protein
LVGGLAVTVHPSTEDEAIDAIDLAMYLLRQAEFGVDDAVIARRGDTKALGLGRETKRRFP